LKRILIASLKSDHSGVPLYTLEIIKNLNSFYVFDILTNNDLGIFKSISKSNNINVINLPIKNSLSPFNLIKTLSLIKKFLKNNNYDILHSQGTLLGFAFRFLSKTRTIHVFHGIPFDQGMPLFKRLLFLLIEFFFSFNNSIENIVLTNKNFNSLTKLGFKNIIKIENFCRLNYSVKTLNRKPRTILAVGGFRNQKNYKYLFKLFSKLPNSFNLTIAGTNTDSKRFISIAKSYLKPSKIKNISFLGSVKNLEKYYLSHDIYIQTSIYEGFSLAALEARFYNMKLVLSNTSGTYELIKNEDIYHIIDFNLINDVKSIIKLSSLRKKKKDNIQRNFFNKEKFLSKWKSKYNN